MTRAERALNEMDDHSYEDQIKETLLGDVELISPNQILNEITMQLGSGVGTDFINLVMNGKIPDDKDPLISFFNNRTDYLSKKVLQKLVGG